MRCYCIGLLSLVSLVSNAQGVRTAYFLDSFHYRHQLNPALSGGQNYFSLPGVGNVNIALNANVGISNFLFPTTDTNGIKVLSTFMSRTVDSSDFLNGLKKKIRLGNSADLTVFSTGFKAWGGFNTIDIGLHSRTAMSLPYELFEFMKTGDCGVGRKSYSLRDIRTTTNNYIDIAFGHSHQINDKLRIGAKVKFLLGLGRADIVIDRMDIEMSEDQWIIDANGEISCSLVGFAFKTNESLEVEGADFIPGKIVLSSGGLAFDLGASYEVVDNLFFSATIIDIGFIKWNKTRLAKTKNESYVFDGFEQIGVGGESFLPSVEEQFESLGDDLQELIVMYDKGETERLSMLSATLSIGLEYALPVYDKLSIGVLSTTYFNKPHTWTEGRLSANIAPVRWFEASVSGVYSSFGGGVGFFVNFHPKGFSLFFGSDFMLGEVTPQFVPVGNCNVNLAAGINFPLNW